MHIDLAQSTEEIQKCFPVMVQLRTTLTETDFIKRVKRQQESGYKLAFVEDNKKIVALAGFRVRENLFSGKFLWVEDLVTDSNNRSKGYGDTLFNWLIAYAQKEECTSLQLDSGVQKFDAHRFYMRKRMSINSYLFGLPLNKN